MNKAPKTQTPDDVVDSTARHEPTPGLELGRGVERSFVTRVSTTVYAAASLDLIDELADAGGAIAILR